MAADDRNRVLAGECISRAQVEATGAASLEDIAAAVDACDHERAALLALARAHRGEPVPIETIMRVLPGIELPAITCGLIAIATGERAQLLELLERRRFPVTKDAIDLEVLVLAAAWRAGAPLPRVIPQLRRIAARATTAEAYGWLATMAAAIDDPHVQAVCKPFAGYAKEYGKQVAADERAMTASVKDVIASLPPVVETSRAAGFTVRSTQQVGRNDPCPCGSGLKYKKCCADKPAAAPSPIPGVSWDDFLAGDKLEESHVAELPLRDLVRVDATRMPAAALTAAARRFMRARAWAQASRIVEVLVAKTGDAHPRADLANTLLECHEIDRARAEIARLPPELAKNFELELSIVDRTDRAWPLLVEHCARILASDDKLADSELAYALLYQQPEVGIVFARACIASLRFDDPDLLLEAVEDARDRLGLPPTDPAWTVLDALSAQPKQPRETGDDAGKLRAALGESSARIDQLERTLAAMRAELDDARTRPAAELMRAPDVRDGLDDKVRELEALIREGNAERRELRRALETATAASAAPDSGRRGARRNAEDREREHDDDASEGDEIEARARGIILPRFDRRASDAFGEVPVQVASEAMRTIGTLAAGDGFAWRGVKQAKDMTRQVLMARVGIHHRLLFRVENGVMDVLDLITREQLMTTLKRLRAR